MEFILEESSKALIQTLSASDDRNEAYNSDDDDEVETTTATTTGAAPSEFVTPVTKPPKRSIAYRKDENDISADVDRLETVRKKNKKFKEFNFVLFFFFKRLLYKPFFADIRCKYHVVLNLNVMSKMYEQLIQNFQFYFF